MSRYDGTGVDDARSVDLPDRLVTRVEARLQYSEFDDPGEWISYAIEEVLARVERETEDPGVAVTEAEIERRLESLGYLDR